MRGSIPSSLDGLYVRNGSNPQAADSSHWFLGDGMVHGIRLSEGDALWYRNRYVLGGPNTHVIGHAGKTLAIVEAGTRCDSRDFSARWSAQASRSCPSTCFLYFNSTRSSCHQGESGSSRSTR